MKGSEFVSTYAKDGLYAWEAAALALAEHGSSFVDWPWVEMDLSDEQDNTATLKIRSDVLAIGDTTDFVRLPLRPGTAQDILNLTGALLPTPLLVYRIWQHASLQLVPTAMVPNQGANLAQYVQHSTIIDEQIRQSDAPRVAGASLTGGIKKHVVVSNVYQPGKVVIFGWYRPSPPASDVLDDHRSMLAPDRQPIQPLSNVHGDFYVDYSHGIQAIHPQAIVNGQTMPTELLYQDPKLSHLVSHEGPVRMPRYPSKVAVQTYRPAVATAGPASVTIVPNEPGLGLAQLGFSVLTRR